MSTLLTKNDMPFPYTSVFDAIEKAGLCDAELPSLIQAYQQWRDYAARTETLPRYGVVYGMSGTLYSLPYWVERLRGYFVGIEINGVVFLSGVRQDVNLESFSARKEDLMKQIQKVFPEAGNRNFRLMLPTVSELGLLLAYTREDTHFDVLSNSFPIDYYQCSEIWVTPYHSKSNLGLVRVDKIEMEKMSPLHGDKAALCLVTHPDKIHLICLRTNHLGMLQEPDFKIFQSMLAAAK